MTFYNFSETTTATLNVITQIQKRIDQGIAGLKKIQYILINTTDSNLENLTGEILQGTILRPVLFIIYINSIPELQLYGKLKLYEYDTAITYYGNDTTEIYLQV